MIANVKICVACRLAETRTTVVFASGSPSADLMIVGDATFDEVVLRLGDAQKRLRREINPTIYPAREFRAKVASGNHFLASVVQSKKLFVFGSENDLREPSAKRLAQRARKRPEEACRV